MPDARTDVVFRLFDGTAAAYDEFVERATLGLDSRWKREIFSRIHDPRSVVDLASGTGIVSFGIAARWPGALVTGVELQHEYFEISRRRAADRGLSGRVKFVCDRAEEACLAPGGFDHVVTSYLPKYADLERLIQRISEWLEPGGRVVLHDFTYPTDAGVLDIWSATFDRLCREAESSRSVWATMMRDLPGIITRSGWVGEATRELQRCGFEKIEVESLSMGCAAIVAACRPA
jgi:demethylmenaquinone methyltransferase/2-methoxy-6-polyprenyl-1,4-benzoquinol methylase